MNKVLKIILNSILILIIILLSTYAVLRFMDKIKIYNVETGSMEDKIHTGDYILLLKKNNYYVGDVVTYSVKGYFITHRIVKIENDTIVTKGDANNTEDAGINVNQIVGKVIYCGGILNFIINYKFVIAAFWLGLYLLSCYFGDGSEDEISNDMFDQKDSNKDDAIEIIEDIEEEKIVEEQSDNKEEIIEKPKRTKKKKTEQKVEELVQEEKNEIKKEKKTKKTKTK